MRFYIFILLLPLAISCHTKENKVAVLYDEIMLDHNTGEKHPENPERVRSAALSIKKNANLFNNLIWPSIKSATDDELKLAHTESYLNLVKSEINKLKNNQQAYLSTGDVVISKDSERAARIAVGAGLTGIDMIMRGDVTSAFALVRPPGHHATSNKGMGFCLFNNIAIAAKYLQKKYGIKRILIVDYDVHHGNGTQDIFYDDGSVFYFSVHQHPLYPGTGSASEIGFGNGDGATLNVELSEGSGDDLLIEAFNEKLLPQMKKFKPEFILVSSGFDGHKDDALGGLSYSAFGYRTVARILKNEAKKYTDNKIMFMLEGGYTKSSTNESIIAVIDELTAKN